VGLSVFFSAGLPASFIFTFFLLSDTDASFVFSGATTDSWTNKSPIDKM